MIDRNELLVKAIAENLIIKTDKLAKILRENKKLILSLFKKYDDNKGLGSVYRLLSNALFIRGIKAKNGNQVSVGTLTTTMKIIRDEK